MDYQTGLSGLCQIFCSSSIIEYLPDWFIWGHYYKYHIETKNNQDKFVENELSQKWLNLLKMVPILSKVNPILNDVMISTEHVQIRDLITYVCAFYEWWRIWRDLEREILWMWILWTLKVLEIWRERLREIWRVGSLEDPGKNNRP